MEVSAALLAFSGTAALLTVTPGADTALVLRIAARAGSAPARSAGVGVVTGVLLWGVIAGIGLGAVLTMSEIAYRVLQIAGALYLLWLALQMFRSAASTGATRSNDGVDAPSAGGWFAQGLMTNLLNPKVGLFYVSLLPQFIPNGGDVLMFSLLYATIHAALGLGFFAVIVGATDRVSNWLRRPTIARTLDGLTGTVLVIFAARLLMTGPRQ